MACGTPVVAFAIGGLNDTVQHQKTGWLARPFDTGDIATGIRWLLEDEHRLKTVSLNAREFVVKNYDPVLIAAEYYKVYQSVLARN